MHCGFNAQKRICSEIVGTRGALEIPDTFFDNPGALTLTTGEERREIPVAQSDRYRLEVEDFADAILRKRAPRLSLAETQRNMEILAAKCSAGFKDASNGARARSASAAFSPTRAARK